jgi:Tfp pilus assembly protein PilF
MRTSRQFLLAAMFVTALSGCAVESVKGIFQTKGEQELSTGIRNYEDGKYGEAAKTLQGALDAGLNSGDQVKAHKYLAFIHCASSREKQCRDEFRKALDLNPSLELEPAEAGHPIWGPVFRSVKARR